MEGTLQAQVFLLAFNKLLKDGKVRIQPRNNKTWEFMIEQGLREADILEIAKEIKSEDYQWGPDSDRDRTEGAIFLFFHPWNGIRLYIKIKLWTDTTGKKEKKGAIISFHEEGKHND